ncbi:Glycerophosphoryl diester phosphodiesterase family-domain-containing protein [Exophiala viscosa]|uniref:Glycerophosphoryl diester phosphodiesterase family-domain-containing protein n=1 Tax=Exophiala viscosa TaxID=2486360 RepID=A0AAN6IAZ0_9EURO|nr:Glycerophosphoryl diester phosphodiesterase family-domain-containing protein [Exophiala viscosa]
MKFGRNLPRNQVPEWASAYINYKALKKLIKAAAEGEKQNGSLDLAGFFHTLDRNLEDVDHFYNKKFQDFSRRLKLLEERYGVSAQAAAQLDRDEREDLLAALLELRGQLRKLQWYGEVNRRGFIKITKKLDKRIPAAHAQKRYLELKVDPSAFATNAQLFASLNRINDWLSILNDIAASTNNDDVASISSASLKRTTSRPSLNIPTEQLAQVEAKIRQDDAKRLQEWLQTVSPGADTSEPTLQQLYKTLLQRAISSRSRACTAYLLGEIVFLDEQDDINRRNCVHRLVISIGRKQANADQGPAAESFPDPETELYNFITPATAPSVPFKRSVVQDDQRARILTHEDEPISFLQFLLDNLQPVQRSALLSRDTSGRTSLHFAAEYGVRVMCEIIIEHLKAWKLFDVSEGIDGPEWQDNEGWAPLHLSAIGGHPLTTQALLAAEESVATNSSIRRKSEKSSAVLALATKANFIDIVRLLVNAGVDVNYQDEQGDTALHVAARFGRVECAKLLLEGSDIQKANTELCESTYGWTPLFISCVDGHLPIVELLIEHGADLEKLDSSGWNAKEHAALRGHVDIAQRLASIMPDLDADSDSSVMSTSPPSVSSSLAERNSNGIGSQVQTVKISEPVKTFGHRYLTDRSMILVSLGTMDTRKNIRPVHLDRIPMANVHTTQLDTALSIVVSAKGAEGEAEVIDLPVQDNISTEPIVFHASDPSSVKILFDLIPTYAGSRERIVGRGVALLSTIKASLGTKRMPLQGDVTVPIIAASDLEVIGSVTFNFLVITPFQHPNMSITENQTYWKSMSSTMVIGHRGLGKNFGAGRRSLQLGENTIQSFIAAANLGASYVEFDVQLTKDHVPVIYHDFLVSETGIDAPVHTLTLEQFLHVNDMRTPRHSRPASPVPFENPKVGHLKNSESRSSRVRSMSLGGNDITESVDMDERMKHTRDFKKKGFKGNSRGNHIQAPFATLEEMFIKLPSNVGFNIEMKYPMLSESEEEEMDTYAVELNSFVDTVLAKVYDLGKGRNIIFSSFNPDICLLLSFKQPSIPVLFLTDAGTSPIADIRGTSLQEAVRFASRWNLLGVVSAAEPLVAAPRLVRVVKESGLVCVSYGTLNNDSAKVKLQVKQGIDAVIVDSVLAIRRGLTGEDKSSKKETQANGGSREAVSGQLEKSLMGSTESLEIPVISKTAEPENIKLEVPQRNRMVNGSA